MVVYAQYPAPHRMDPQACRIPAAAPLQVTAGLNLKIRILYDDPFSEELTASRMRLLFKSIWRACLYH